MRPTRIAAMAHAKSAAFGLCWLAASCAAITPESRMAEGGTPPSEWSATRESKSGVDQRWIRNTGGAELASLVAEALKANPDLKQSAARVEKAAAEAKIAGAARWPALGLSGRNERLKQVFIGTPIMLDDYPGSLSTQAGVALNAAWEIDVWGKLKAGKEAAMADAESSALTYQAARASLAGQVAKAWLALAEANAQVALAEEGLTARRLLAAAVRERFEGAADAADGGSAAQVRLTEAELASGEAVLAERRQEKTRAIRQLELLLGRYPSGRLIAAAKLPPIPSTPPAGVPSELLLRRPDIHAAERRLAADGRRSKEARLARFPSIKLTGSMGTNSDALGQVLNSDYGIWSVGGSLTQPLFEGGRLLASEQRAKATERESAAALQGVVLQAFGEVEQALAAELHLREREAAAKRAAGLAMEAANRAQEEFDAGTGDVLTLIDSRQSQIDTASRHTAIRRLRLDNRINLHLALGGDFSL